MTRIQQLLPLLRPRAVPRSITAPRRIVCPQRFQSSTAAPPAPPTNPQDAARAADLAAAEAITESDSAQPPDAKPVLPSDHASTLSPGASTKADNVPTPPAPPASKPNTESALKEATLPASTNSDAQADDIPTPPPLPPKPDTEAASPSTTGSKVDDVSIPPPLPSSPSTETSLNADIPTTTTAQADDVPAPPPLPPKPNTESALKKAPKTQKPSAISIELPPPKYHVSRSNSKNLPVYTDYKRGGNLHLTTVRKITGDMSALRDELRVYLNKKNEDVKINSLTGHVIIKGHHSAQIKTFLEARGM
jgi:large subunit ribosomal protein L49